MEFKGTKGQWLAKLGNEKVLSKVHIGDMDIELEINGTHRIEEERANALLISKAPELLQMINILCEGYDSEHEYYIKAKKLIYQATKV